MLQRLPFAVAFAAAALMTCAASAAPDQPAAPVSAGVAQPPLSPEDKALVDRAAAYLDGLGEMHGHFVQTDARGAVSQGELFLDRPGKARFDYQNPASLLVVSDGHGVYVLDRRLKTFDRYPLGATPLALFLQKHVRLDQKVVVTRVERFAGGFSLTARDGKKEAQGQIELTFQDNPIALKQWSIRDAQGARTTVRLTDLEPASGLDPALFVPHRPAAEGD
jgi:outer membrane lipoprotein-sorting protein